MPTFTLADVAQIVSTLGGLLAAAIYLERRINRLEFRVDLLWKKHVGELLEGMNNKKEP